MKASHLAGIGLLSILVPIVYFSLSWSGVVSGKTGTTVFSIAMILVIVIGLAYVYTRPERIHTGLLVTWTLGMVLMGVVTVAQILQANQLASPPGWIQSTWLERIAVGLFIVPVILSARRYRSERLSK